MMAKLWRLYDELLSSPGGTCGLPHHPLDPSKDPPPPLSPSSAYVL